MRFFVMFPFALLPKALVVFFALAVGSQFPGKLYDMGVKVGHPAIYLLFGIVFGFFAFGAVLLIGFDLIS